MGYYCICNLAITGWSHFAVLITALFVIGCTHSLLELQNLVLGNALFGSDPV